MQDLKLWGGRRFDPEQVQDQIGNKGNSKGAEQGIVAQHLQRLRKQNQ